MSRGTARASGAALVAALVAGTARGVPDGADAPAAPEPSLFASRRKHAGVDGDALRAALDWLARHRVAGGPDDGGWSLDGFGKRCVGRACGGPGIDFCGSVAPTALALLAFLGAGETSGAGERRELVAKGLGVLVRSQGADGCFGPRTLRAFLVAHSLATSAVAEAYWATKDPALREPLIKGRDFLLAAQNSGGGWRYDWNPPSGDDTYMTACASIALRTVELAGVDVPKKSREGALTWLDRITDSATGRAGYATRGGGDSRLTDVVRDSAARSDSRVAPIRGFRTETDPESPPSARGSAMTAAAALVRALAGGDAALVAAGARAVESVPPDAQGRFVDLHTVLFGSLLFAQDGGGAGWRTAAVRSLLSSQQSATWGCAAGSFDPDRDRWGPVGGRVYATAMAALVLEAPTRFPRVPAIKAKKPGTGSTGQQGK